MGKCRPPHSSPKARKVGYGYIFISKAGRGCEYISFSRISPLFRFLCFILQPCLTMAQSMNPNGTPLNLYYINCSPPSNVSELEWERWFTSHHVSAIISSGIVTRAALYKEVGFGMIPNPSHPRKYMILYQTDFKRLQDSEMYRLVNEQTDAGKFNAVGDDDVRNYKVRLATDFFVPQHRCRLTHSSLFKTTIRLGSITVRLL